MAYILCDRNNLKVIAATTGIQRAQPGQIAFPTKTVPANLDGLRWNGSVIAPSLRPATSIELEAIKDAQDTEKANSSDALLNAIIEVLLDEINTLRTSNSLPATSLGQLRTAIKAKLRVRG